MPLFSSGDYAATSACLGLADDVVAYSALPDSGAIASPHAISSAVVAGHSVNARTPLQPPRGAKVQPLWDLTSLRSLTPTFP